jgi:hypothetical protein
VNNANRDLEDGSGYKLDVGFTGQPFLDINLEYRNAIMVSRQESECNHILNTII